MSQRIAANSSKLFFARLRSAGNEATANILKCSEGTVSELSGKEKYKLNFNSMCELLARMGLKVVPAEHRCMDPEKLQNLLYWAQEGMAKTSADDFWDED